MFSLLKIVAPLILGLISGMMKANMEAKQKQMDLLLRKAGFEENSRKRAANLKGRGIAWTRRYLAILFATSFVGIISTVILAGIFNPDFVINVPKDIYKHSIFSYIGFVNPVITTEYIKLEGLTLVAPLIEKLMIITEAIIGFYFGSRAK